jgi:hypothetical protein
MPQFLSSVRCNGIDVGFKCPNRKGLEDSSQVSVEARKLELHIRDHFSVQNNFWTAIGGLHICNMVDHHHVETTCEGAY